MKEKEQNMYKFIRYQFIQTPQSIHYFCGPAILFIILKKYINSIRANLKELNKNI